VTLTVLDSSTPVANDQSLSANEDTAKHGTLTASDADGDALTFALVLAPAHGTLASFDAATGTFIYIPPATTTVRTASRSPPRTGPPPA